MAVVEVEGQRHVLINPEIVAREGDITWEEGCLSIPDVYGDIARSARVVVRATGLDGKEFEVEGTELMGVCFQHEIDHLHGKLFIDHLSFLKRRKAMAAWDEEKVKYPDLIRILTPGSTDGGESSEGA
jgi:peptide deformylase